MFCWQREKNFVSYQSEETLESFGKMWLVAWGIVVVMAAAAVAAAILCPFELHVTLGFLSSGADDARRYGWDITVYG